MKNTLNHLNEAHKVLGTFLENEENIDKLDRASELMSQAFKAGKRVYSCGNGGSMCDAMHFAEELSGKYRNERPSLPALAIADPSYISCTSNDFGYEFVFERFIDGFGQAGDVLLAISTSGNSENVVKAAIKAREKGMKVIGLTGKNGGKLAGLVDLEIRAPQSEYADRAQEIHIKCIHIFIDNIETQLGFS